MNRYLFIVFVGSMVFGLISCDRDGSENGKSKKDWLAVGSNDERFSKVSKHLRGFDMAMVETGYRYVELYWAGQDKNWEYAEYQIGKIKLSINNGLERRPARASSAKMIFPVLDQVSGAIKAQDFEKFDHSFRVLTQTCNSCHASEGVGFFKVNLPFQRPSPISSLNSTTGTKRKAK
jgi:hypothetical protein